MGKFVAIGILLVLGAAFFVLTAGGGDESLLGTGKAAMQRSTDFVSERRIP
jgi:hypothetical protein